MKINRTYLVFIFVVVIVFFGSLGLALYMNHQGLTPVATSAPIVTSTSTAMSTSTTTSNSTSISKLPMFIGSGSKETESFYIPSGEWQIAYTVTNTSKHEQSAFFSINVHPQGEPGIVGVVSHTGSGSDYTIIHDGPGNYCLKIFAANCNWRITVTTPP